MSKDLFATIWRVIFLGRQVSGPIKMLPFDRFSRDYTDAAALTVNWLSSEAVNVGENWEIVKKNSFPCILFSVILSI